MSLPVTSASAPLKHPSQADASGTVPDFSPSAAAGESTMPEWIVDEAKVQMSQLPVSEQQEQANRMAQTMSAADLKQFERAFADGVVDLAVENYAPSDVKTAYQALSAQDTSPTTTSAPAEAPRVGDGYLVTHEENVDGTDPTKRVVIAPLAKATTDFVSAKAKVEAREADLKRQLADVAPSLTDKQRQQYIVAFQETYKNDYDHYEAVSAELSRQIKDPRVDLSAKEQPDVAKQVVDAVNLLAGSDKAADVTEWLGQHFGSKGQTSAEKTSNTYSAYMSDADVAQTFTTAEGNATASPELDPREAAAKTAENMQLLVNAGIGGVAFVNGVQLFSTLATSSDPITIAKVFKGAKEVELPPKLMAAGYFMALGTAAISGIAGLDTDEKKIKFSADLLLAGSGGADQLAYLSRSKSESLFSEAASMTSRWHRSIAKTEAGVIRVSSWGPLAISKMLGFAATALYTAVDIKSIIDDPKNLPQYGVALGDALSLGLLIPGGAILGGVGLGIAFICTVWKSIEQGEADRTEEKRVLGQIGMDSGMAANLVDYSEPMTALAKHQNFTPEIIQKLASQNYAYPQIYGRVDYADAFGWATEGCGVAGDDILGLADAMSKDNPDFVSWLGDQFRDRAGHLNGNEFASIAREIIKKSFPSATAYAARLTPDLFDDASDQRALALREYNLSFQKSSYSDVANHLLKNSNPAYRAELISLLTEGHQMEPFIYLSKSNPEWNEVISASIDDAVAAGRLTQDQAKIFLEQLSQS